MADLPKNGVRILFEMNSELKLTLAALYIIYFMKAMLLAGENGHTKSIFKIFAWIDNRIRINMSGQKSVENRKKLQEFVIDNPVIKKHFKKQFKNFKLLSNGLYDWMDKQHTLYTL